MNLRKLLFTALLTLAAVTAWATSNYEYGADEYVTIYHGISPDDKLAITTHGEGYLGTDHFHVYLFDAIAGKKIGPLEEIKDVLDTEAGAYAALWKKDASEVAIVYRVDRHAPLKAMSYRLGKGRAFPLTRQPVDLRDSDPLVRLHSEAMDGNRLPDRVFGMPKPRL